jgi:hypothetical protein
MKRIVTSAAGLMMLLALGSGAGAQMRPMTPPQHQQQPPSAMGQQPMMGPGVMGMMCPMMGMGMGPGMMGGVMGMSDPKAQARMLKLHGDMMKAMGEVMLKHGQALEQEK